MPLDFPAQGAYAVYIVRMGDTGDGSVRDEINATVGVWPHWRMPMSGTCARWPLALTALSPQAHAIDASLLDLMMFRDVRLAHGSTMFHLCFDSVTAILGLPPKSGSATLWKAIFR